MEYIDFIKGLDRGLFLLVNSNQGKFIDALMIGLSSKWTAIPLYAFMLFRIWRRFETKSMLFAVITIVLAIVLSDQGSVHLFKNVFERLRPCHDEALKGLVRLPTGYCGGMFGFVSSHAANVAALISLYALIIRPRQLELSGISLWAFLVGYSRVYLGAHYPGDVLCGFIFGFVLAFILYFIHKQLLLLKTKQ